MRINREQIRQILYKNYKSFHSGEYMFGIDTGQNNEGDFERSNFRVLIVYLSSGKFRSASNTYNAVNSIIKRAYKDVFVDYCYFSYYDDKDILDKLNLPYIFGNVSGATVWEYDLVLINCSVIKEQFNLPLMLQRSGIALSIDKRMEDKDLPLFVLGGSSANVAYGLFGDINYDGDVGRGLIDLALFGKGEETLVMLIKYLKENKEKDKIDKIDGLFATELRRFLFYPKAYEFEYDGAVLKGINIIDKYKSLIDIGVKYSWNCGKDIDFSEKIFNLDGSFSAQGDLLISSGCTGKGACSFCLEGTTGGVWSEKSVHELTHDMEQLRLNSACESLGIFSYNSNYYSDLYTLVGECSKHFDRISLLASRADVYANDKNYLNLVKQLGTVRVSIASEGISEGIRNRYLNKNLTTSDLYKAVYNIMSEGFLSLKINYILTGKERENDFEEWLYDLGSFSQLKESHGFKTQISITITNLVIYDQTALRYEERVMAKHSMNYNDSVFIKEYIRYLGKIKELGIKITIYGTNYINCVEQLLLDLGCRGTSVLVEASLREDVIYERDLSKNACLRYISLVKNTYNNVEMLFDARSAESVFYSDMIEYTTSSNRKTIKDMYHVKDYSNPICTNSKKIGSKECNRCEYNYCYRDKLCKKIINNNNNNNNNSNNIVSNNSNNSNSNSNRVNDITTNSSNDDTTETGEKKYINTLNLITINNTTKGVLRIVINRKNRYDFVNASVQARLAYVAIQRMLIDVLGLDKSYVLKLLKSERYSSLSGIISDSLKGYYSGQFAVDFGLRGRLDSNVISYINENLNSIDVYDSFNIHNVSHFSMGDAEILNHNDYNIFVGTVSRKMNDPNKIIERIKVLTSGDSVVIKTKDTRKSVNLMLKNVQMSHEQFKIFYDYKGKDLTLGIICKCNVSPYLVLKTLYSRASLESIYINSNFSLVGSFKSIKGVSLTCSKCGGELYFEIFKNRVARLCLECYCKAYLYIWSRR